jgi:exodeoxyribonuclease VIII
MVQTLRAWRRQPHLVSDHQAEPEGENKQADNLPAGVSNSATEKPALLRPVSRLRLTQRLIAHLINDTEEKEISEERHIEIGQMESDDSNQYVQNLLLAAANVPEIKELSAHVEWNLVSAIKQVFQRDQVYTVSSLEEFITEWVSAPEARTTTVHKWLFDKEPEVVVKDENVPSTTTPVLITVATLPCASAFLPSLFLMNMHITSMQNRRKPSRNSSWMLITAMCKTCYSLPKTWSFSRMLLR